MQHSMKQVWTLSEAGVTLSEVAIALSIAGVITQ